MNRTVCTVSLSTTKKWCIQMIWWRVLSPRARSWTSTFCLQAGNRNKTTCCLLHSSLQFGVKASSVRRPMCLRSIISSNNKHLLLRMGSTEGTLPSVVVDDRPILMHPWLHRPSSLPKAKNSLFEIFMSGSKLDTLTCMRQMSLVGR